MSLRLARSQTQEPPHRGGYWKAALQAAVNAKTRGRNGTVLILGSSNTGKSTLIRSLQMHAVGGGTTLDSENLYLNTGGAQLTDCAVLPARPSSEPSADYSSTTAACFLLQKRGLCDVLTEHFEQYLKLNGLETMTVLITVNVAEMIAAYEQAEEWLTFLVEYVTKLVVETDQMRSTDEPSLITKLTELKERNASDDEETERVNLGIQVIVCGCRSDNLPSAIVGQSREKTVQESIFLAHMRNLCHKFGASLLLINAQEDSHPNCAKLFNMICAPIVGETHTWEPVTDPVTRLFIPASSETAEGLKQLALDVGANLDAPIQTEIEPNYKDSAAAATNTDKEASGTTTARTTLKAFLSRLATSDPSVLESVDTRLDKQTTGDQLQTSNSNTLRKMGSQTAADTTTERRRVTTSRPREEIRASDSQEAVVKSERRRERTRSDRKERTSGGNEPTSELKNMLNSVRGKTRSPKAPE